MPKLLEKDPRSGHVPTAIVSQSPAVLASHAPRGSILDQNGKMTMKVTQEEVPKNQLCHKRTRPLPISTVKSARDKDIWHVIKAGKETTKCENNTINASTYIATTYYVHKTTHEIQVSTRSSPANANVNVNAETGTARLQLAEQYRVANERRAGLGAVHSAHTASSAMA
ncbi:hypothetical protein FCULG_00008543 [Fusarium culmorum]|uniref:Uncharacterized protein n=1 Tax=Fusarium culmorum TaxID=5516 RepID=A0A2T4H2F0_FUSCU|nr:hypothetical protein FCULG_00008543 [Fusarium culmorum]